MGHKANHSEVLVVPDWLDHKLYHHILDFVEKSPEYDRTGYVDYKVPWFGRGMKSRNPHNAGPTIEELAEAYGNKAIRKACRIAEKSGDSVAFLFSSRGHDQLYIRATFYRRDASEGMGCEEEP